MAAPSATRPHAAAKHDLHSAAILASTAGSAMKAARVLSVVVMLSIISTTVGLLVLWGSSELTGGGYSYAGSRLQISPLERVGLELRAYFGNARSAEKLFEYYAFGSSNEGIAESDTKADYWQDRAAQNGSGSAQQAIVSRRLSPYPFRLGETKAWMEDAEQKGWSGAASALKEITAHDNEPPR